MNVDILNTMEFFCTILRTIKIETYFHFEFLFNVSYFKNEKYALLFC